MAADEIARFVCSGFVDTNVAEFDRDSWTTDSTRYIIVEAASGAEAGTDWVGDGSRYTLSADGGTDGVIRVTGAGSNNLDARFIGLQIESTSGGALAKVIAGAGGDDMGDDWDDFLMEKCYVRFDGSSGNQRWVIMRPAGSNQEFNNCVFFTGGGDSTRAVSAKGGAVFRNCTAFGDGNDGGGFELYNIHTDTPEAYNCIGYVTNSVAGTIVFESGWGGDFNASSDDTAPGANSLHNISDPFENGASSGDAEQASDAETVDAGDDLSPDVTDDILGTSRPQGSAYDIGAHELEQESGQTLTVDSVVHVGNWTDHLDSSTASDIATAIGGETADDDTYAQSEDSPSTSPLVFKFSDGAFPDDQTAEHKVTVRIRKSEAGGEQIDLTLELREGYVDEGDQGTLIASESFVDLSDTVTESELTLTEAEAGNITDYTDLYGRVVANVGS